MSKEEIILSTGMFLITKTKQIIGLQNIDRLFISCKTSR